ncbi:hypothetical protein CEUSTIGMA_g7199.t1 [Chlamydomonas eustigma]|uniref:Plastid lipid-associated protein/fibrillin conserved domain-containing protein n=1 Tax=Chlamydomonas eustigma TaxID=1157962 RepID=A0A250X9K9_9CHLO|nr:hypothetical protein CEUSTIGMA_g7199.t1 [Chlamydomonas eustigma]|eukprot:GAX79758.1 hypothetical protein CEUSTIGMA_g7199.t1 [Chlamydomonas eustigma]
MSYQQCMRGVAEYASVNRESSASLSSSLDGNSDENEDLAKADQVSGYAVYKDMPENGIQLQVQMQPIIPCAKPLEAVIKGKVGAFWMSARKEFNIVARAHSHRTDDIKSELSEVLVGLDRGIFGVNAAKKEKIVALVTELESLNPDTKPLDDLSKVQGNWKLLYSTITITGSKRTKLGLREFISLGNFTQTIVPAESLAANKVDFSVSGLGFIKGSLTINAAYRVESPKRVLIDFQNASLVPGELQKLFEANYELLLSIFNPQGWLEITYLDESHRIGRDDKGNIFYLQREKSSSS